MDDKVLLNIIEQAKKDGVTELDLSWKGLTKLPPEIGQLTNLTILNLGWNLLSELPPEVSQLTNLKVLDVRWNLLRRLPAQIGKLSNLIILRLHSNKISTLPPEIGQLTNLMILSITENELTILPLKIGQLTNLIGLHLDGNRLPIPPEIISRANEPNVIIQYYLAGRRKPLNEAKLVLVGQGRVGKTSLVKRLIENQFYEEKPITEGIAIKKWSVTVDETKIRLNIWDFGGQEIMHATHQFFMTKRTLYLLVLDAQWGEEGNRIDYWLKLIQSFGQDSLIIVISNKSDLKQLLLNQKALQKQYPTIKAFVHTSCKSGKGIAELHKHITAMIGQLEHVRNQIPLTWLEIKAELEGLKHDYIPYRDYVQLCRAKQINQAEEQRILISLLHDLGVVLSFQDDAKLSDTSVLNPTWVTGGVYKIINAKRVKQTQGVLQIGQLDEILHDHERYAREMHLFMIEIMRKFELCFEFEGHTEEKFLIPDLLSEKEPLLNWSADGLDFEYRYDFLPSSVISRFMVRMNLFIFHDTRWRHGMILVYNKNRALIKATPEYNRINISIVGPLKSRWKLWTMIYEQFASIHKTIKGLNARRRYLNLNPQAKLLVAGDVEQVEAAPEPVKREEVMDLKNRLEEVRLRTHPQKYYPLTFLLGQRCYEELKDYTLARQALVKAHEAISMWRSLMREQADEKHKQLSEECVSVYEMLVDCYLVEGDKGKAFEYASIGKGRAFVNTLARSRFDFEHVPDEEADFLAKLEQIRQMRRRITYLDTHSSLDKQKRRGKQDVLLREEAELWREMEREYPLLTATLTVPTLSVEQAGALAQELDATLVEYYRHAKGWCAFVVSQSQKGYPSVRYVRLPQLNDVLLTQLVRWRNELRWFSGRNWFLHRRLERLYEAAIVPLGLKSERVVIAPFERLHLLPLSAAYDGEKYLAEKHTLSFVPSLTALHVVQQERKLHQLSHNRVQRLLSVAYPGPAGHYLPNVLEEAEAIVERLEGVAKSKKLHQAEATPENVIRDASAYDIIHFGCHGRFDVQKPQESGLRLAGKMVSTEAGAEVSARDSTEVRSDSYLTVQRIITELNLKDTRLATLAACLTGEVKLQEGEEHVGLLQAMMAAGVQTVVASLWHVDDAATRFLFEAFYLQEAHLYSSPQAMRYASHFLRQQEKWRHPYYWAAFQVNGLPPLPKKQAPLAWPADLQHNIQKDDQQRRVRSMMCEEDIIKNAEILLDTMREFRHEILPALKAHPLSEYIGQQQTDTSQLNIAKALHYIVQDNPTLRKMFPNANVGKIRVSEIQDKDDMTRKSRRSQEEVRQISNTVINVADQLDEFLRDDDSSLAGEDDDGPSLLERFIVRFNLFRKR